MHPLDNPIWNSLTTKHAHLALGDGAVSRYPPECAPFLGIAEQSAKVPAELVAMGEHVGIIGVIPPLIWKVVKEIDLCQYVLSPGAQGRPEGDAVLLTETEVPAMLELTALVYPHYFRSGTPKMGSYLGFSMASAFARWPARASRCRDFKKSAPFARILTTGAEDSPAD